MQAWLTLRITLSELCLRNVANRFLYVGYIAVCDITRLVGKLRLVDVAFLASSARRRAAVSHDLNHPESGHRKI